MPAIYTSRSPAVLRKIAALPPRMAAIDLSALKLVAVTKPDPAPEPSPESEQQPAVKARAKKKATGRCGFRGCGKVLDDAETSKRRVYCNCTCRRREQRMENGGTVERAVCAHPQCEVTFTATIGNRARGMAQYCCRGCKDRHKKGLPPWHRRAGVSKQAVTTLPTPLGTQEEHR